MSENKLWSTTIHKLYRIPLPSSEPTSISDYKKQNYLLQTIPFFSLGFDGIKLGNWNNTNIELPYIIAGSVIEFDGQLYEAKGDIFFIDECEDSPTDRYIVFYKNNEDDYLQVKTLSDNFPAYVPLMRGFYNLSNNIATEKYLRVSMKKENGEYRSKKYWDTDDVNRTTDDGGGALKKYTQIYKIPGTFNFEYPMNAESVVFHIMSGGGGGGGYNWKGYTAGSGSKSEILIGDKVITSCGAGEPGGDAAGTSWVGEAGIAGIASGRGNLYNGSNASGYKGGSPRNTTNAIGGLGGDGRTSRSVPNAGGGGSGSCAIVEVLRSELGASNTITIEVGRGGTASPHAAYNYLTLPKAGVNGSVYLEYYA